MRRHDIRLRREKFTSGRISKHKDFGSLLEKHKKKSKSRLWFTSLIVAALILMLVYMIMLYFR